MPTTNYNGKEVEYEDMTPTWEAMLPIYISVLQNPTATVDGMKAALNELNKMARLADKFNESQKKT